MTDANDESILLSPVVQAHMSRLRNALAGMDDEERDRLLMAEAERVCEAVAAADVDLSDDRAVAGAIRGRAALDEEAGEPAANIREVPRNAPQKFVLILGLVALVFAAIVPLAGVVLGAIGVVATSRLPRATTGRGYLIAAGGTSIAALIVGSWLLLS
ncbi:hypothetical protein HT102_10170 [Hoyosella sp. G463]|uniref:Uncharacterized protein n=1 Tax=Lolliginicoccus lacisalsi TaxID=2742202 RepID=A0A927PLI1_9ACTN|nr:hypothetical protein [Lolliginicoccus lacisalsi]MBD8506853.1 hypothetical protein [Lolliginicoccus lacisalsi]